MRKQSKKGSAADDDLEIPETPPEFFKHAVMGKYYREVMAGSNLVRVAPDVQAAFPNEQAVNRALRELLKIRERLVSLTAGAATRKKSA